ncbi:MAG TPA: GNAT family N-acetyltransferase [Dehalococcoidia bacterium]|nr:GNAT family N-acetyltransferase [Dehalococcoidia bacterium]
MPSILTPRLELVSMSPPFVEAVLGGRPFIAEGIGGLALPRGWPDDHDRHWLERRLKQMTEDDDSQQWLGRAIVLRGDALRPMIGHIGFHEAPRDGVLEMGYTVFEKYRRQGYAHEAIHGMMRWAHETHGIGRFRVSVSPENAPSLALAAKLGFQRTGEQMDPEDGLEYVFERDYEPEPAG